MALEYQYLNWLNIFIFVFVLFCIFFQKQPLSHKWDNLIEVYCIKNKVPGSHEHQNLSPSVID